MKTFIEHKLGTETKISEANKDFQLFSEWMESKEITYDYAFLNEEENITVDHWVEEFFKENGKDLAKLDEGFLGKLVGGVAGFLVGPTIGKIVAKSLGIERGILYDMFCSRLVSTALGSAIAKYMTANKITKA